MKKLLPHLLFALLVVGCSWRASVIYPTVSGGSKADAVVELFYNKPSDYSLDYTVDWNYTDSLATQRCRGWGFKNAEKFERYTYKEIYGATQYTIKYQCIN